jgi:hypothetical protein
VPWHEIPSVSCMNKTLAGLAGGLAGAITLTLLAELLRKNFSGAPRLDKLGEEALDKTVSEISGKHMTADRQYSTSMAADLISNTLYYSATAFKPASAVLTGAILGATAGAGAVKLPGRLGLNEDNTAGSPNKKLLTVALYTIGGLIAGLVTRRLTTPKS